MISLDYVMNALFSASQVSVFVQQTPQTPMMTIRRQSRRRALPYLLSCLVGRGHIPGDTVPKHSKSEQLLKMALNGLPLKSKPKTLLHNNLSDIYIHSGI